MPTETAMEVGKKRKAQPTDGAGKKPKADKAEKKSPLAKTTKKAKKAESKAKSPPTVAEPEPLEAMIGTAASSRLDVTQVAKSVRALLTHVERQGASSGLLDDGAPVHVLLATKHMPKPIGKASACKPVALALPHPYQTLETAEICLITKDPQREYKDKLAAQGLRISKVIGVSKLKKK